MFNNDEFQQLHTAVQELSILNEIASAVSSVRELKDVVDLILQKCVKHLNVEQGAILLLDEEKSDSPFQTMVRKIDSKSEIVPYHFSRELSGWMLKNQKPLLINNFLKDRRFSTKLEEDFSIRSLLSVPLLLKGRIMGLLNVFNKNTKEGFTPEDQRLISIIAAQSAQVIENARLYEEEQNLLRMEEELRFAYEIQINLLPKETPEVVGYDIVGKSIPAKQVGGDYYDFIPIDENKLAICLGDVSGKGMPAALLMANLQATLRAQVHFSTSCKDSLQLSNRLLFQSTDIQKFVTLFYGILDISKNQMCYSSAGHEDPFLFSRVGNHRRLEIGGTVLGFLKDITFEEDIISFKPGDLLLVYSDGITEAMNRDEEEFGEERLEAVVRDNIDNSASELTEKIIYSIRSFTGEIPQMDDITLAIIKRK